MRNNQNKKDVSCLASSIRDSHGVRTHDPNIKSVVLYQLS